MIYKVKRLLREEGGFTLPEMLVTMMIMITVLFALYNIFDMSIRVFSFGNDKVEAVENARLGLEKMERELRAAYPYDKVSGNKTLIANTISNPSDRITFGNDLDGNRKIECPTTDKCEVITYKLYTTDTGTQALGRYKNYASFSTGTPTDPEPVVEFAKTNGLAFRYLDKYGTETTDETKVAIVQISLNVEIDRGNLGTRTQTLTTDVNLRNRES